LSRVRANGVFIEMIAKCFTWFRLYTYGSCHALLGTQRKLLLK